MYNRNIDKFSAGRILGSVLAFLGLALIIRGLWFFIAPFSIILLGWIIFNWGLKFLGLPFGLNFFIYSWAAIKANLKNKTNYYR